ncbi:hypothetical protein Hanom_Chr10g00943231 [Helianthus anomalus]
MIYVGYSFPYCSGLFWVSLLVLQIDGSTKRTVQIDGSSDQNEAAK